MNLLIDFDNTWVSQETLDVLADLCAPQIADNVRRLTYLAMTGELSFAKALRERVACLDIDQTKIDACIALMRQSVSSSFQQHVETIQAHADNIYVISGGFREIIVPIVTEFGVHPQHVFANTFHQQAGRVVGIDTNNVLAQDQGKVTLLASLALPRPIVMVGDGMTDYTVYAMGQADRFFAYTEHVQRTSVIAKANEQAGNIAVVLRAIGWLS